MLAATQCPDVLRFGRQEALIGKSDVFRPEPLVLDGQIAQLLIQTLDVLEAAERARGRIVEARGDVQRQPPENGNTGHIGAGQGVIVGGVGTTARGILLDERATATIGARHHVAHLGQQQLLEGQDGDGEHDDHGNEAPGHAPLGCHGCWFVVLGQVGIPPVTVDGHQEGQIDDPRGIEEIVQGVVERPAEHGGIDFKKRPDVHCSHLSINGSWMRNTKNISTNSKTPNVNHRPLRTRARCASDQPFRLASQVLISTQ